GVLGVSRSGGERGQRDTTDHRRRQQALTNRLGFHSLPPESFYGGWLRRPGRRRRLVSPGAGKLRRPSYWEGEFSVNQLTHFVCVFARPVSSLSQVGIIAVTQVCALKTTKHICNVATMYAGVAVGGGRAARLSPAERRSRDDVLQNQALEPSVRIAAAITV